MMSAIRDFVMAEPLFDNHEHQGGFTALESRKGELDYKEFLGYAEADVVTAGGTTPAGEGGDDDGDGQFFTIWSSVRTTGYGQATELACRTVLDLEFNAENADRITEALRAFAADRTGEAMYSELLKLAGVRWAMNDACWDSPTSLSVFREEKHPESFGQALRYDDLLVLSDRSELRGLEKALDRTIHRLTELDAALDQYTEKAREAGKLKAMKCGLPYRRALSFEGSSFADAERAFEALMQGRTVDLIPLHDYLFHRFVQRADEFGLPIQFHTGYLAGNRGGLAQGDPGPLIPVLQRYSNVRFDLFHAGWPYSELMCAIGKAFPNVWLDMCWAWAMNPAQMERTLSEWLSAVPHNKIFGFGGDTGSPFPLVGYARQARQGIANVLEAKVERGEYAEETARRVARRLMHENAREFYKMD
jgi:hypothetical protein